MLFTVFPNTKTIHCSDSLEDGLRSLGDGVKHRLKEMLEHMYTDEWVVEYNACPTQHEDSSCALCMCINGMLLMLGQRPEGLYSSSDIPFLRRYIAAILCESGLPAGKPVEEEDE